MTSVYGNVTKAVARERRRIRRAQASAIDGLVRMRSAQFGDFAIAERWSVINDAIRALLAATRAPKRSKRK